MAKKRTTGLGKQVLFQQTGNESHSEEVPSSLKKSAQTKETKSKATFYLSDSLINTLEDSWIELRRMVPRDQRKAINKSTILEAALRTALVEYQEQGEKSELYQAITNKNTSTP